MRIYASKRCMTKCSTKTSLDATCLALTQPQKCTVVDLFESGCIGRKMQSKRIDWLSSYWAVAKSWRWRSLVARLIGQGQDPTPRIRAIRNELALAVSKSVKVRSTAGEMHGSLATKSAASLKTVVVLQSATNQSLHGSLSW